MNFSGFGLTEFNSTRKDITWARLVIERLMIGAEFLIGHDEYNVNRDYANGVYETDSYKKNYYSDQELKDDAIFKISFQPIDLMSVYGHVIKSAIDKQPIIVKTKCKDRTATSKLEEDIAKKRVQKELIDPFLKLSNKALGANQNLQPKQSTEYNSNMEQADALGLDMGNSLDKAIFENVLQRGKWDTSLGVAIDHFVETSDMKSLRDLWEDDFLIANAIASMVYINSANGLPEVIYIRPDNAFTIGGDRKDKRDAEGKGFVRRIYVRQFLMEFYDQIKDWDEINEILQAANICTGTNYTTVWHSAGEMAESDITSGCCSFDQFCNLKLTLGYIEWKSQNMDKYEHVDRYGNDIQSKKAADYAPPPNKKVKNVEDRFYEVTYRAMFVNESPQLVYGFGLLPRQLRYGAQGELSDFSVQTFQEEGQSIVERCIPFIKSWFGAHLKFEYFLAEAKLSGYSWNYYSLNKVSSKLKNPDSTLMSVEGYLRFLRSSVDSFYIPEVDDEGKPMGGDATPFREVKRGIEQTIKELIPIMERELQNIRQVTGVNEIRLGTQQADAGLGVSQIQLIRSQDATLFIDMGLMQLMSNAAKILGCNIQQIIYDKSFGYEALERAIGEINCENIDSLGLHEPSAYNIFISIGMSNAEKQKLDAMVDQLILGKIISFKDGLLIQSFDNFNQAQAAMIYFDQKAREDAGKNAQAIAAMEQASKDKEQAGKERLENIRGGYMVQVAKINKGMELSNTVLEGKQKLEMQDKKALHKSLDKTQSHLQNVVDTARDHNHELDLASMEQENQPVPQQ